MIFVATRSTVRPAAAANAPRTVPAATMPSKASAVNSRVRRPPCRTRDNTSRPNLSVPSRYCADGSESGVPTSWRAGSWGAIQGAAHASTTIPPVMAAPVMNNTVPLPRGPLPPDPRPLRRLSPDPLPCFGAAALVTVAVGSVAVSTWPKALMRLPSSPERFAGPADAGPHLRCGSR
jgi:hypothetical protein